MLVAVGLLLMVAAACLGQGPGCEVGPARVLAGNFTVDLDGAVLPGDDERGDIWGLREAFVFPLRFTPPEGRRVRILGLSGDLTARLTRRGTLVPVEGVYPFVGVLGAVTTLAESSGSAYADWAADDTLAYVQADIGRSGVARIAFREDLEGVENALLGPEHTLWFKVAKYLDETGFATHLEITFSQVKYRFECE